ncbi:MAG: pilus assembly protein PilM [Arhodomonas sp.]|nr:pilus assembly protein PilM [Arhodomonas sp.]
MPGGGKRPNARLAHREHVANPFAGMSMASRVATDVLQRDAPSMLIACGLAMRSFD